MPSPKRAELPPLSPRKRAPQKRALEKRAAIIEAAIEEFGLYGFAGATTRQISKNAGVLNSLLHHHFPDKDDLWRACADFLFQDFGEELRRIRQHVEPGAAQLKAVIRAFLVGFVQRPEMGRFLILDNRVDLARQRYITERHMEGLFDWLTASVRIAQANGDVVQSDPMILVTYLLNSVSVLGTRRPLLEDLLKRPVDTAVAEYEALIHAMVFRSR